MDVRVVSGCRERIQHWQQVEDDYSALQERLGTLPDKLSYSIMVPFGPFAFMPGKLVHTNEVTVLLGDNWFAKCSAKQAVGLVEHRRGHVRKTIDDLKKVMTNFESRVEFTEDLQKMSDAAGDIVDIREEIKSDFEFKAKHRIAHKPHSKPKTSNSFEADFANVESKDLLADQELWARLEELERQEELLGELESQPPTVTANGEDTASSEEEKEDASTRVNGRVNGHVNGTHPAARILVKKYPIQILNLTHRSDLEMRKRKTLVCVPRGSSPFVSTSQPPTVTANGEDTASSEEEKEDASTRVNRRVNRHVNGTHPAAEAAAPSCRPADDTVAELLRRPSCAVNGSRCPLSDEDEDGDDDDALGPEASSVPTIYFSHTVEPKRVRINTGKNTTLKFSEKKEEAKRKRRNSCGGHPAPELPTIRTPADIYRVFVDLVNGAYIPRKSILKSRSRENSVCSDTSEGSADCEERRGLLRSVSCQEAVGSDAGESILEEEQEQLPETLLPAPGTLEAFSGTVIEKELSPCLAPHPATVHPVLPTIPERREVPSEGSEVTKRVSKFKAARLQQRT
ncbi:PREDICTED: unconventional prefoldin RPB5 interactor 1 [Myotis brandtii]|uniref:unconventional prefoldin RPB5 interactor 1 n=1 Tax=Myotis brandtii TaxID=109478 RepID=UPI0007043202|nr:PREDICTED: unconventional prefoldin RPB5 interactor 1 [Myotis brandtii]